MGDLSGLVASFLTLTGACAAYAAFGARRGGQVGGRSVNGFKLPYAQAACKDLHREAFLECALGDGAEDFFANTESLVQRYRGVTDERYRLFTLFANGDFVGAIYHMQTKPEVDVNAQDEDGNTALHVLAAVRPYDARDVLDAISTMKDLGAAVKVPNHDGLTPRFMHRAVTSRYGGEERHDIWLALSPDSESEPSAATGKRAVDFRDEPEAHVSATGTRGVLWDAQVPPATRKPRRSFVNVPWVSKW